MSPTVEAPTILASPVLDGIPAVRVVLAVALPYITVPAAASGLTVGAAHTFQALRALSVFRRFHRVLDEIPTVRVVLAVALPHITVPAAASGLTVGATHTFKALRALSVFR